MSKHKFYFEMEGILYKGGVSIIFQIVLSHRKRIWGDMKLQVYVLGTWSMSLINFRTSIPHTR
jgi:hypothetical protein